MLDRAVVDRHSSYDAGASLAGPDQKIDERFRADQRITIQKADVFIRPELGRVACLHKGTAALAEKEIAEHPAGEISFVGLAQIRDVIDTESMTAFASVPHLTNGTARLVALFFSHVGTQNENVFNPRAR